MSRPLASPASSLLERREEEEETPKVPATHAEEAAQDRDEAEDAVQQPEEARDVQAELEEGLREEKKKEENREKGLQYQVITNTSKIKKMSRKQLKQIRKADTSGVKPKILSKS